MPSIKHRRLITRAALKRRCRKMSKSYLHLSKDIGELKRLESLECSQPSGSQTSHAGKMKNKSPGARGSSRSKKDLLGREYLGT